MHLVSLLILCLACKEQEPENTPSIPSERTSPVEIKTTQNSEQTKTFPPPITERNWKKHPDIVKIQGVVAEIQQNKDNHQKIGWTIEEESFSDGCGEEFVYKIQLWKDKDRTIRAFHLVEGQGDIFRESTHFYETGKPRFVMSTYTHSSAESKYISRLYLKENGRVLFVPKAQLVSENPGPIDDLEIQKLLISSAENAGEKYDQLVSKCKQ